MSVRKTENLLDAVIGKAVSLVDNTWDDAIRDAALSCLLDYVGVTLAGSAFLKKRHETFLDKVGPCDGSYPIIGMHRTADAYTAALLNGLSSHVLELDDGHRYGMLHPGAPIITGLLSSSRIDPLDSEHFLKAIAAGYEAMITLGRMIQPEHKKRGFHATATCGSFGVAIAISILRRYPPKRLRSAASAALTASGGLLAMGDGESQLKPYNCAQAVVSGITAANIALCEYGSPVDAIGEKRGFILSFNGGLDSCCIEDALRDGCYILGVFKKVYASCRHIHPAIEAALAIRSEPDFDLKAIASIVIETYDLAISGHDHSVAGNASSAKMSIPLSVSIALCTGESGIEAFRDDVLQSQQVRMLASKVKVVENKDLSLLVPKKRSAIVTVNLASLSIAKRVDYPKGEPENPLAPEELRCKFIDLLGYAGRSCQEAEKLFENVSSLEANMSEFLKGIE
ncbi:MmgE/PrpD family protein [Eggerthella guodeyinii]|uniref:MmgE/PrpD family protein n=1 Tax=Eggerthella guodeyinii TaxID=2690837 RepID=A0A6L7IP71_9ACTN|nr:MmgE/PrpD family protein [Eggerthella guodeyinii]QOS67608.1 MmgE/PrpD family protein [Eggerthella guodeyinii]